MRDLTELKGRFPGVEAEQGRDIPVLKVPAERLTEVMMYLQKEYGFNFLADLTGVDEPGKERLVLVYHLMAVPQGEMVRVKVELQRANPCAPSLVGIWPAAEVQEREAYDLLGITFEGHPDLRRILCPDDFEGHPLRKDFRLTGEEGSAP
ncbi:MAG TPA: NADH-quinone oxidoreductase subunit C [Peptococcaceae bacterium]|nr:MAG: NADH-quinone oxidoreductase subunit C [Moorella sp. 60_41]HBT46311.1 NADH-quinone oxidoreductase subunit C [Peptococcaceae bacterium]